MNANEFQEAVGARASNAFPNATVHSICARMRDEITQITVAKNQEALYRACAEVATQLIHIAHIEKFSLWTVDDSWDVCKRTLPMISSWYSWECVSEGSN